MNNDVKSLLRAAIECSIYVSPLKPGLFGTELAEIGRAAGYQPGEINDALLYAGESFIGGGGFFTPDADARRDFLFMFPEEPNYRDVRACDFVVAELVKEEKAEGAHRAQLDRSVIVARALDAGLAENAIQVAITTQVLSEMLIEKDGVIRFRTQHPLAQRGLPSDQLKNQHPQKMPKPFRAKAYPLVQDVVARRGDGRAESAEPIAAFAAALTTIGYGHFRMWWTRMAAELDRANTHSSPIAVAVLAAALVEGALTFAARYARDHQLAAFQSTNFDSEAKSWKIEKLIDSATVARILDGPTKAQADALTLFRQRIHAGRMLSEHPGGVPDIKPEESRAAKITAELVTRRVLEWLAQNSLV